MVEFTEIQTLTARRRSPILFIRRQQNSSLTKQENTISTKRGKAVNEKEL